MKTLCGIAFGVWMSVVIGLGMPDNIPWWVPMLNSSASTAFMISLLEAIDMAIEKHIKMKGR